jgi:hypothetical protein
MSIARIVAGETAEVVGRYRVLSWRDIPSQVKATDETGAAVSTRLPARFQERIDQEAMRLGLYGTDAYLEEWTWSAEEERPGSAEEVAAAVVAEIDAAG